VCRVSFCWSSLAQSILVLNPIGTFDRIFILKKLLRVLKCGILFDERRGLAPLVGVIRAGTRSLSDPLLHTHKHISHTDLLKAPLIGGSVGLIVAGPRRHSHSCFWVPRDSWQYFTLSRLWKPCYFPIRLYWIWSFPLLYLLTKVDPASEMLEILKFSWQWIISSNILYIPYVLFLKHPQSCVLFRRKKKEVY
jgi:hypothetical protein